MKIRRIVPTVGSTTADLCRAFYCDYLGLRQAMDLGWIATYASPTNPTAQISVARGDLRDGEFPSVSVTIEVDEVDDLHREAVSRGYRIVYPLTDEPWGVRRFAVADPNGLVINVMRHGRQPSDDATPAE